MEQKYNVRNPAVKRLMREARELLEATEEYCAKPLDDNLFEWHFTVHGSPGTDYEGGVYHGRILLPPEYPMKPPNIILLTPNGRFETNKKICLSISGHHPETWQPSWSIRTALLALIAFMSSPGNGAIGSLDYTPEERKFLAKKSQNWSCPECGKILSLLSSSNSKPMTEEETNIISQIALKAEENLSTKNSDSNNIVDDISELVSDINNRDDCNNFSCNTAMASDRNISVTDTNDQTTLVNETQLFSDILLWSIVGIIILLILRRLFFV